VVTTKGEAVPKTREQKENLVKSLEEKFAKAKSAVLINYKGLKVKETEELREKVRTIQAEMNVTKNTLVKIAIKKSGIEISEEILDQPLAIAFSYVDEVAPAKEIHLYGKEHEALEILGGILEHQFISADDVRKLAQLPSREELYAKTVGSIASPLSGMVNVLQGNIRGLVSVLSQYSQSKQ
jgi:large subunit ribosomal protein L10